MKALYYLLLFMSVSAAAYGQAPANDDPQSAVLLPVVKSYCSNDGAYTSVNAIPFFTDQDKDVWFKFTAIAFDVSITATGNGASPLNSPGIDIYSYDASTGIYTGAIGSAANGTTVTTYYKGGLTIGNTYYFRVYGRNSNTGTFKLCVNNYNPILQAGQDYGTASILCSKASFTQTGVTGAGLNNREAAGTCLDVNSGGGSVEANTAWYKWTAANSGTLTFTITPTVVAPVADDIDWVLYDLGTTGDPANVNSANAVRCDASRGVDCTPPDLVYYKTGIRDGETHTSEPAGCGAGQDGFVQTINMIQGHVYGLLINNFSNGNNGFTIDFGGTGEFVGPAAAFTVNGATPCTAGQVFTFINQSANYKTLQWSFGEGAVPATATGDGSFAVTYTTVGQKTAVLLALGAQGCTIVADTTFTVGIKPPKPIIDTLKRGYCLLDTLILKTPAKPNYTYQWVGPNNFTSADSIIKLPLTSYGMAGKYVLSVTQFGCTSDTASVVLVTIGKKPVLSFIITSQNLCTASQSFIITNRSSDYTLLNWDYGTGANKPTQLTDSTVNITYSTFGDKTITLTATGDKGCVTILSQTLTVPVKPAIPALKATTRYCVGDTITLSTVNALTSTTYQWGGPNNFTSSLASPRIPVTGVSVAGTYYLVITQGACSSDTAKITISPTDILLISVASFTATPPIPSKQIVPIAVLFKNNSTNADTFLWNFGDGGTSTDKNPIHTYQTKGDFTVTLTATNQGLCNNTIALGKLIIRYDVVIFIPNTFSPNGDGINDLFNVKMTNIKTYHIQIFNRYGIKLFDGYDINNSWPGVYNNSPVPAGTYYYLINAVTLNDDPLKESGYIAVIR